MVKSLRADTTEEELMVAMALGDVVVNVSMRDRRDEGLVTDWMVRAAATDVNRWTHAAGRAKTDIPGVLSCLMLVSNWLETIWILCW